jgi:hypothetical protein
VSEQETTVTVRLNADQLSTLLTAIGVSEMYSRPHPHDPDAMKIAKAESLERIVDLKETMRRAALELRTLNQQRN